MTKTKVTLKDLSRRTGFDISTISRVLRDDRTLSIRQENIDLIKAAAQQMNYVPNAAGRSLRSSRTYSIGALVPSLENPIHAQIVQGASEACRQFGYSLILAHAEIAELQIEVIRELVERNRVDALIALTFRTEYSKLGLSHDIPIMAVNWRTDEFASWVMVDEKPGAYLATKSLIDLGHRKIAHLSGVLQRFNAAERLAGHQDALTDSGIALDPSLVEPADYDYESGFDAMNRLLDRKQGKFSAVFVVSMMAAAGAISALQKRGLTIPDDVSVVGFHDGLIARAISPSLSTVAFPLKKTGEVAATGLIKMLEGNSEPFTAVITDKQFLSRDSSGPPGARWRCDREPGLLSGSDS